MIIVLLVLRTAPRLRPRRDADFLHDALGGARRRQEGQVDQIVDAVGDESVSPLFRVISLFYLTTLAQKCKISTRFHPF